MPTPNVAPRFSAAAVTREPDRSAQKFILTGRSGIGKTWFVSTIPGVFIVPVEEGLKGASPDHDPAHFEVVPRTLAELHQALDAFAAQINVPAPSGKRPHAHLVIDSLAGVETLVHEAALGQEHARHMDAKDYKVIWTAAATFWGEFQKKLDAIRRRGTHVWLIAHSAETVDAAASGETFRKWDLQFRGTGSSLLEVRQFWRGWADHVFFLDWVAKVTPSSKGRRSIGQYEGRVLHTRESATYYAKTRGRLPPSIAADWKDLLKAMTAGAAASEPKLRAQLAGLLTQLAPEDRTVIEADATGVTGANGLAAIVSRAQGMLAVKNQEEESEAATNASEPSASHDDVESTPVAGAAQPSNTVAAPAELDEPIADTDRAPPDLDPELQARAVEFERQIDARVGADLEAMPEIIKVAKLPEELEKRVRERYVARVKALRSAARGAEA